MTTRNIPKAQQLQETLDRLNEDLLSLSDEIWLNIDHNDTEAMREGVAFKEKYNDKLEAFARLSQEMADFFSDVQRFDVEDGPEMQGSLEPDQARIIASLDKETPHRIDEDFRYKRPHAMILQGVAYDNLRTWKAVYHAVITHLQRLDSDRYLQLPDAKCSQSKRGAIYIGSTPKGMRVPEEGAGGLYFEVNQSATLLQKNIRRLLAYFSIPETEIAIYLREDRDA